jgi:hypothetical protein
MRTPVLIALSAMVMISACERRTATPGGTADSTAAADSAAALPPIDTMKPATMAPAKSPRDSIIGHDSAFGPIGAIDSTGKVVPIRPKRP